MIDNDNSKLSDSFYKSLVILIYVCMSQDKASFIC